MLRRMMAVIKTTFEKKDPSLLVVRYLCYKIWIGARRVNRQRAYAGGFRESPMKVQRAQAAFRT